MWDRDAGVATYTHFNDRLRQRYRLDLRREAYDALVRDLAAGRAPMRVLRCVPGGCWHVEIQVEGRTVLAVWDHFERTLVTALHPRTKRKPAAR